MKQTLKLLTLWLGISSSVITYAQNPVANPNPSLTEQIRLVENNLLPSSQIEGDSPYKRFTLEERLRFFKVPAVSIAVIDEGAVIWAKAYGVGNRAKNNPIDTHTAFWAGSISKSINAVGVLKLVANSQLSLEPDFRTYLKTVTFKENDLSRGETITIRHLLSHTAGLSRGDVAYYKKESIPTLAQALMGQKPSKDQGVFAILKPNTAYKYSNYGIGIVQKIIEDNIDPDYAHFVQSTVLDPLNMTHSFFIDHQVPVSKQNAVADGHWFAETIPFGESEVYPYKAASNLWTTPSDVARLIMAIQASYAGQPTTILPQAVAKLMLTPPIDTANYSDGQRDSSKCGLGFFMYDLKGEKYFSHTGGTDGFRAIYIGSFEGGKGAVVMTNSNNASILFEILNSIATTYGWKNYYQPKIKKEFALIEKTLLDYCGKYKQTFKEGDYFRSIKKVGNHLEITGSNDLVGETLYFSSETEAFVLSRKTTYHFILKDGKVEGLTIKNDLGRLSGEAKKVGK